MLRPSRGTRPIASLVLFSCSLLPVVATRAADTPLRAIDLPALAAESRPRLAIIGLAQPEGGDPRDAWLPAAVEEALTWKLRRLTSVVTSPTQRLHQARLELSTRDDPRPDWNRVCRALGATHRIHGLVDGHSAKLTLKLTIEHLSAADTSSTREIGPGRLLETVDQAALAVAEAILGTTLSPDDRAPLERTPTTSLSAIEYATRGVTSLREGRPIDALRYLRDAVDSDPRYRPALGALAQLEMRGGENDRRLAARHLRAIIDLARSDRDDLDRLNAELGLSMLSAATGAPEAALTRAETALDLARARGDVYSELSVIGWIADLYLTAASESRTTTRPARDDDRGLLERSAEWQRRLIAGFGAVGDHISSVPASTKLALTLERIGNDDAALQAHEQTLTLAQTVKSRPHEASAWVYLAQWRRARSQWDEALAAAREGLARADESAQASIGMMIADIYRGQKQLEAALAEYQAVLGKVRATDDLYRQFVCLRESARLQRELGQPNAARTLTDALDLARALELSEAATLEAELATWRAGAGKP